MRNDGQGTLEPPVTTPLWGFLADVDADGDLDGVQSEAVVLNDGTGQSQDGRTITLDGVVALRAVDANRDGNVVLFGRDAVTGGRLVVLPGTATGTCSASACRRPRTRSPSSPRTSLATPSWM